MSSRSAFWDDLARDLEDPEFFDAYVTVSLEIAAFDAHMTADEPDPSGPGTS